MKTLLLMSLLWLLATPLPAQTGPGGTPLRLRFRLGRVVLVAGDTLDGPVALQFGPDLLFLAQPDGSVRTFTPTTVAACAVQQEITGPTVSSSAPDPTQVRLFRALPWYAGRYHERPEMAFFEQLGPGPALLLRRQHLAQRMVAYAPVPATVGAGMFGVPVGSNSRGLPPPSAPRYLSLPELREEFFLARPGTALLPLRDGLKELYEAFPLLMPQLQAYGQLHHLSRGNAHDLAELVGYANSLATASTP